METAERTEWGSETLWPSLYLLFYIKQASRDQQGSGCGPPLTVHRGHPLATPGVWALHHDLTLSHHSSLSLTITSIFTALIVFAELRLGSVGPWLLLRLSSEQTPGGIIPQSKQTGNPVFFTMPSRCTRCRSGGAGTGGCVPLWDKHGLKRRRRRSWRWCRRRWGRKRRSRRKAGHRAKFLPYSPAGHVQTPRTWGIAPWVRRVAACCYPNPTV